MQTGITKGLRVNDPALAAALGLEPDDILTALSGRVLAGENDLRDALFTARSRRATTLYVEILRGGATPTLLRWQIDGDLRAGSFIPGGTLGSSRPPWASMPTLGSGGAANAHDPLVDTVVMIDDTSFRVPRSTLDAIAGNPYRVLGTLRVIPSMKNGVPDGYRVYAIRPSTLIAQLGVRNGDTLHSIAGEDVGAAADPTGVFDKLAVATTIEIELTRRGKPVTLTYEITK